MTGLTEMTVAKICNSLNLLNEAELHIQKAEQILRDHSQTTLTSKVEGTGKANANDTTYSSVPNNCAVTIFFCKKTSHYMLLLGSYTINIFALFKKKFQ